MIFSSVMLYLRVLGQTVKLLSVKIPQSPEKSCPVSKPVFPLHRLAGFFSSALLKS